MNTTVTPSPKRNRTLALMWKYRHFYIMFLPVLISTVIFFYLPMFGIRYSFFKFTPFMKEPEFIGWANFQKLFITNSFWSAFENTMVISLVNLALGMICSLGLALLLNEIRRSWIKRSLQTIVYLPHFLSWVVVAAIFTIVLSPGNNPATSGLVNAFLVNSGLIDKPIQFLTESDWWRPVFYFIYRWKETGWGTVVFLAALTGVSPDMYEAASIDGAGKWRQCINITIPSVMDTFVVVLILNLAKVMNLFESVLVLWNIRVNDVADVLQTYVFRTSIVAQSPEYGYPTAVGLFRSVVAMLLVILCDRISKKLRGRGIM